MKTSRILLLSALALVGAGAARAIDAVKGPSAVDVVYFEREKFTDVKDGFNGTDRGRDDTLETLKEYLTKRATRGLLPGQKLSITISDVDLAGDFEPWRGSQWSEVRIVKEIYPPRIKLAFRLTDAEGTVLKQGERDLRDMAFMMKMTMGFRDDPLRHEKALLDDWLSEEFRPAKKA
ncbi:MAG: DUF3016 domain-containing protein [Verrucomicrobia bacterium]|nr:DUF3016 domain-containing protein [Verrucomicrobiota bacterium]